MVRHFVKYFVRYIFFSKTRQRLLFIALTGLFISSFALLVLQSIMGGLQNSVISRSIKVEGSAVLFLKDQRHEFAYKVIEDLREMDILSYPEYEMELLVKGGGKVSPLMSPTIFAQGSFGPLLSIITCSKGTSAITRGERMNSNKNIVLAHI